MCSGAGAWAKAAAIAALFVLPTLPDATRAETEKLEEAVSKRMTMNQESLESQRRIEELSDETEDLLTRYRAGLRQVESLQTYNHQMEVMIDSQQEELAQVQDELDRIDLVSRDVTPLMLRMIEALDQFVALDVPFLEDERRKRIQDIRKMMRRADVSDAEKFRRIMEAYQIENEYGRTIEAYRSTLERGDRELTVDFLRVGRIALVYQTLDESEAGVWNQEERRWDPLDRGYRSAIRQGLRIARKQAAPDLIRLPLPPAEPVEGSS